MNKRRKCKRCGETRNVTTHHWIPVCHFGRKGNNHKVPLCELHHKQADEYIIVMESVLGNVPYGTRVKLEHADYRLAAHNLKLI
jgi:hypothetical protein